MKKIRFTQEQFLDNCKRTHGDLFDYSKALYKDCNTGVIIICKIHGDFTQTPLSHVNNHCGCPTCAGNIKLNRDVVIEGFKKVHGDTFDYSKVNYINTNTKVEIICKVHGSFFQIPKLHNKGSGCPRCSGNNKKTTEEFVEQATKIHRDRYDYSKTNYTGAFKSVVIICKKHGEFTQMARKHLFGHGCTKCQQSKGETEIIRILEENKISYIHNKQFNGCVYKRKLRFDFYLPDFNICIEFDGQQHFAPDRRYNSKESFRILQIKDNIKNEYCKNNGIPLKRIKYAQNILKELKKILPIK